MLRHSNLEKFSEVYKNVDCCSVLASITTLYSCIQGFPDSLVGASGFKTTINLNHACFIATLEIWKTKIHWRDGKNKIDSLRSSYGFKYILGKSQLYKATKIQLKYFSKINFNLKTS